ncbi:MAG TPA: biopolymer transporter ExbD [Tepidisphaeraceae bacterium]|jgi:biopolymer transport protein ExbD
MKIIRRKPPEPHIPFISLADIAWQIIIFFLVASSFAQSSSLNVSLPSGSNEANVPASAEKTITVEAAANTLRVNNEEVAVDQLQAKIAGLLEGKKTEQEKAVVVIAKDDVPFQRDVDIMYAVQQAGGILVMSEEAQ